MEERLLEIIQNGAMPHALLIAGPAGSGKAALARRAAAVYCFGSDDVSRLSNCPGYTEMTGEDTNIERVRTLMSSVAVKAFNDDRRAFVLLNAHRMDPRTQNALLKVLEEPPAGTLLILTGSEMGLLPTVRSRCMIRRVGAAPIGEVASRLIEGGVEPKLAQACASAADGVEGLAAAYASEAGAAFRASAITLLERAMLSSAPFADCAELVQEDTPREGKKRRAGADKVTRLFVIWEDVLRDALLASYGVAARNIDAVKCSGRIAASFTEAQIQSIIEMLMTAQQRLFYRASPALTLDAALAKISLKEKV